MRKKKMLLTILLSALLVSGLAGAARFGVAQTSTQVSGLIGSDATWTLANSPYNLTGDVQVNNGTSLTIEAGVTVNFNSFFLNVSGTLSAVGNQTHNIIMTGTGKDYSGEWRGRIAFQNTSINSVISYAQITSTPDIIIGIYSSSLTTISNSVIGGTSLVDEYESLAKEAAIYINNSSPTLTGNVISSNGSNGVFVDANSSPWITSNTIIDNGRDGILILGPSRPRITENIIRNNRGTAIDGSFQASPIIDRNNITDNKNGILVTVFLSTDSAAISNNILSNNTNGICISFFSFDSVSHHSATGNLIFNCTNAIILEPEGNFRGAATIVRNTLVGNTNAVLVRGGVLPSEGINVNQNNIYGNTEYNVKVAAGGVLDATNNWWGTTDTQAINQTIYEQARVNFVPFLTAPNFQAPKAPEDILPPPTPSPSPSPSTAPSPSPSPSPTPSPSPSPPPSPSPSPSPTPSISPSESPTQQPIPEIPTPPAHEDSPDLTILYIIVSITVLAITIAVAAALIKFWKHRK